MKLVFLSLFILVLSSLACRLPVVTVTPTPTAYEYRYTPPTPVPGLLSSGAPEVPDAKWMP